MSPSKESKITVSSLIENTKSVRREPFRKFNPMTKNILRKNSKVYVILKHGPLPDGDYSYLINNGTLTRYARWLLIACELKMPFMTLLILSRVYCRYIITRNSDNPYDTSDVLREQLYGPMGFDFKAQSIVNMITTLNRLGYCELGIWRSLRGIPHIMDTLEKQYDLELREMSDYFQDIFQSNIYNEI